MMQYTRSLAVLHGLFCRNTPLHQEARSDQVSIYIQDCTDCNDYYVLARYDDGCILAAVDSSCDCALENIPVSYFDGHEIYYKVYRHNARTSWRVLSTRGLK